jgi:hypothetical protein
MFIGESACLIFWLVFREKDVSSTKKSFIILSEYAVYDEKPYKATAINILWLGIPGFCDFAGSSLMYVALVDCAASVY